MVYDADFSWLFDDPIVRMHSDEIIVICRCIIGARNKQKDRSDHIGPIDLFSIHPTRLINDAIAAKAQDTAEGAPDIFA